MSVPLNDIFIHLHAVSDRPLYDMPDEQKKLLEELEALRQHVDLETGDLEEQAQQRRAALWQSQLRQDFFEGLQRRNVVIEDVLKGLQTSHPVAVLLGTPGAGKSTTMRWLALQMARASLDANYQLPEGLSPAQIPLLIRISDYVQLLNAESVPFHEFLRRKLAETDHALPDIIQGELAKGNVLFLFDGLDEVVSDLIRRKVTTAIHTFIARYPKEQHTAGNFNRFLVTSRIVGYEAGPFASYAHYTLLDLEDREIERFLTNWCPAVERHQIRSVQSMSELTPEQEIEAQNAGNHQSNLLLEAIRKILELNA